jgi:hypothetical protein
MDNGVSQRYPNLSWVCMEIMILWNTQDLLVGKLFGKSSVLEIRSDLSIAVCMYTVLSLIRYIWNELYQI